MLDTSTDLKPHDLSADITRMWELSAAKIRRLEQRWDAADGSPVFTVEGRYTARGWTEWTQGFQYGSSYLQFDATDESEFLEIAQRNTLQKMAPHVSHIGVHDHGFNNISTYGNLLRLLKEERVRSFAWQSDFCELALKVSGAVQAARWTKTHDGAGFIYSFNGPHSLFCDTIRSLRSLSVAHRLGHRLMGENDQPISLLDRLIQHARVTAQYAVYYGEGRDTWDVRGRVAHESLFNTNDGRYRAPSTQQGYSPFTTWTRGLAWIMLGYPEQLEFLAILPDEELEPHGGRNEIESLFLKAAQAACDYYIASTPPDGIPYWDTGAPGLSQLPKHQSQPADPFNQHEPVDSSAAAIACQGLIRLGRWHQLRGNTEQGNRYFQAGLTTLRTLLQEPYLNTEASHEGLLLHAVYHRPNNWDHLPAGQSVPCGESCQWGDYHLREAALLVERITKDRDYTFFSGV